MHNLGGQLVVDNGRVSHPETSGAVVDGSTDRSAHDAAVGVGDAQISVIVVVSFSLVLLGQRRSVVTR